jgi:hypothetical protein
VDIHKPKPWRGFREFLKEYAIIVVGVLTALAFEQGVEWLHWRHQISEARAAIVEDQKRILGYIGGRDVVSPCISRRLNEVEAILDKASAEGRLPRLGDIGRPPREPWTMRGWEGIVSGQTLAHLSSDEATHFTAQAASLSYIRDARDAEIDAWSVLRSKRGPGRRLGDAEITSLRAALGRARSNAYRMRNTADQLGEMIVDSHVLTKAQIAAAWRIGFDMAAGGKSRICRPVTDLAEGLAEDQLLLRPPAAPDQSYDARTNPAVKR